MIKKYEEFLNDDIQLNESEERMINEVAEKTMSPMLSKREPRVDVVFVLLAIKPSRISVKPRNT